MKDAVVDLIVIDCIVKKCVKNNFPTEDYYNTGSLQSLCVCFLNLNIASFFWVLSPLSTAPSSTRSFAYICYNSSLVAVMFLSRIWWILLILLNCWLLTVSEPSHMVLFDKWSEETRVSNGPENKWTKTRFIKMSASVGR